MRPIDLVSSKLSESVRPGTYKLVLQWKQERLFLSLSLIFFRYPEGWEQSRVSVDVVGDACDAASRVGARPLPILILFAFQARCRTLTGIFEIGLDVADRTCLEVAGESAAR